MARKKKPTGNPQPKTGNEYIALAEERGALVEPARKGFTKIATPQGSTYITPGTQPLDPRTRKNLNHWFKLLGLMALGFITHPLWLPILRNFLWSNWQIIL